ncbi:zinc finger protein 883-like [Ixodes scapularis]
MTERAFENQFPDYDGSSDVVLPDGEFTNKFDQDAKRHVLELAGVLEKDLDKHTSWDDASVYTGTAGDEGMTERAFENQFPDYDGSSDVVLPDGEFTNKFDQDAKRHVLELAGVLEKDLDKHTSWDDASVYTGTAGDEGACPKKISCLSEPTTSILFNCCFCTHVTRDQRGILTHLVDHSDEKLKCQHCSKFFCKEEELRSHTDIHKSERTFACQLCPAAFQKNSPMVDHIRTHTSEKPFKCQECLQTLSQCSCLSSHTQDQTSKNLFKCELCPQAFSKNANLTRHIRTHSGERPYKCELCPQAFSENAKLTRHVRTHTGERPYKCELCPQAFSGNADLTRHIRIHTGERPYKCKQCPQAFSRSLSLAIHIRTHTGSPLEGRQASTHLLPRVMPR